MNETDIQKVCKYCGQDQFKPEKTVERVIYTRNNVPGGSGIKQKKMTFCCQEAGGMYQMACEG